MAAIFWLAAAMQVHARPVAQALVPAASRRVSTPVTNYDGKPITGISFDPSVQPYSNQHLLTLLPLKEGAIFHARDLAGAIQALFATGRYADISVEGAAFENGVRLTFITKPAYFIGRVEVNGVKQPPNSGQLVSATKLILGQPYHDTDRQRAIESLRNLLRRNGYYNPSINVHTVRDERHEVINIVFNVDAGDRATFEAPTIQGRPERDVAGIVKSTKWKRFFGLLDWRQVTEARLQQGLDNIRRYYEKKDLLLARVNLRRLDYNSATNTVKPVIFINGGPRVVIRAEGAKLRRGKLRQLVPIYQERTVDEDLIMEGQRNIAQYFQAQGYFETKVTHSQHNESDNVRVITYTIDRGHVHKLAKLQIDGNTYFTTQTIRERLYLTPATFPRFPHGRYSEALLAKDLQAITDLYHSNGFLDVKVSQRTLDNFRSKRDHIAVFIQIAEGPQTLVSQLSVEGLKSPDDSYVKSILHSVPGQPYSEVNVASDRDNVLNYFYDNGFLNATFDYEMQPSKEPDRVNLRFVIHPGPQKFVRDVLIGGLNTTKPELVFNRMELHPGDPLSLAKDTDTERRLYSLGIFARVDTALQNPAGDEASKYVLYELDEARRYSINVGVGAEFGRIGGGYTLNAPAGTAGFSPRLTFGVSRLNFLGLGHTVTLQSEISNFEQRAGLSYIVPQFTGNSNLSLTFGTLYDSSHDVRTFSAIRREASVQMSQKLSKANTLQYRLTFRRVTQSDLLIDPLLVPLLAQPVRVGLMGLSFIQDKRDDPADAHSGVYTTLDLGYASPQLASETEFTRLTFRNSSYHAINRDWVFARSLFFGWNAPLKSGEEIPISEHYFAGGATTHRGFPENQAGPRDLETGFPLGGNAVLMNSLELRFPLIGDNLGGVLFLDSGNVYSDIQHISFRFRQRNLQDFNYMVHAAGFGIRYRTPIGPIRIDLSLSPNPPRFVGYQGSLQDFLNPDTRDKLPRVTQRINVFQFHFSLGQAF
ncbi:MAG TPA: POTRA domain-containing protein [Bryobacteraceae bacterium]|nr:POTRA domain-containing protein [Bryobacteraceae bacterium]